MPRVTDVGGHEWVVRRHWAPRWKGRGPRVRFGGRWRRLKPHKIPDDAEPGWPAVAGCIPGIAEILLATTVIVALLWFVAIPLLLALVDVVLVLVVLLAGVVGRVLFRRPWTVEAERDDDVNHQWKVIGWRASGERIREVVADLRHGRDLSTR